MGGVEGITDEWEVYDCMAVVWEFVTGGGLVRAVERAGGKGGAVERAFLYGQSVGTGPTVWAAGGGNSRNGEREGCR